MRKKRHGDLANSQSVPFLDLSYMHEPLRPALLGDLEALMISGAFTNGPQSTAKVERAFAAYCGTADCVGMASGLDALRLALRGLVSNQVVR